jgi:hypothetical protein
VVDLASGEGYGAAWLAGCARNVVAIDIDRASVEHAAAMYADISNLEFAVGDIECLPMRDGCADVVTCFEAIEHVSDPRRVIDEVTRVLKPGGLFLVSTPNKAEYTDERNFTNEFHVHEFYLPDFERLLAEHFAERVILGQRLITGSLLWPLDETGAGDPPVDGSNHVVVSPCFDEAGRRSAQSTPEPMYVLAACRLPGGAVASPAVPLVSVLVDPEDLLLREYSAELDRRSKRLGEQDGELERARIQLSIYEHQLVELRAEGAACASERVALLDRLAEEQKERADILRRLHLEEDKRFAVVDELEAERAAVAGIRASYADTQSARRRAEAELEALRQTRTLRYSARARSLYTRLRRLRGYP